MPNRQSVERTKNRTNKEKESNGLNDKWPEKYPVGK